HTSRSRRYPAQIEQVTGALFERHAQWQREVVKTLAAWTRPAPIATLSCETVNARRASFLICCHHGRVYLPTPAALPELLHQLTCGHHPDSTLFLYGAFNINFAFTSIGVRDERAPRNGPSYYIISGALHHLIGSLLPEPQHEARFAQGFTLRIPRLLDQLQAMLLLCNRYAHVLQNARAFLLAQSAVPLHISFRSARKNQHERTQTNPLNSDAFACILPGHSQDGEPYCRDIIIRQQGGRLERVHTRHPAYDAPQYPLLYPRGEDGWHERIPLLSSTSHLGDDDVENDANEESPRRRTFVSLLQYASYILMMHQSTTVHRYGRLFLQYVVDCYARIGQQRLSYLRAHQRELRAEVYGGICDGIAAGGSVSYITLGRPVVFPYSFIGSPRHMQQQYQDVMTIIRQHGKPDLFVTMTCNPEWPEIKRELESGQSSAERPDRIFRVFDAKLKAMMKEIRDDKIFGTCVAFVYVIEFQKRGLPRAHILLILDGEDKPLSQMTTTNRYQTPFPTPSCTKQLPGAWFMHARAPVRTTMDCVWIVSPGIPEAISRQHRGQQRRLTYLPTEKQWCIVQQKWTHLHNRDVVPYNPYLCRKYDCDCHINVEVCSSVKRVKYLFK
ncbi:TPA: LOW QUALITY PROTEIN: hypothetical protein N0F65_003806, partial [Lagenidium giganteum]